MMWISRIFVALVLVGVLASSASTESKEKKSADADLAFEDFFKPVLAKRKEKQRLVDDEDRPRGLLAALVGFPDEFEDINPTDTKPNRRSDTSQNEGDSKIEGKSKSESSISETEQSKADNSASITSDATKETNPNKRNTVVNNPSRAVQRPAGYILWHPVPASFLNGPIAAASNQHPVGLPPQQWANNNKPRNDHPHHPFFVQSNPFQGNFQFQNDAIPLQQFSAPPMFFTPPVTVNENNGKKRVESNDRVKPAKQKNNKNKNSSKQNQNNQINIPNGPIFLPNISPNRLPNSPFFENPNFLPHHPPLHSIRPPMNPPFLPNGPFPQPFFPNGPFPEAPFQNNFPFVQPQQPFQPFNPPFHQNNFPFVQPQQPFQPFNPPFQQNNMLPKQQIQQNGSQQQQQISNIDTPKMPFLQNGPQQQQGFQQNGPQQQQGFQQSGPQQQQGFQQNGPQQQQGFQQNGPQQQQGFQQNGPQQQQEFQQNGPQQQKKIQQNGSQQQKKIQQNGSQQQLEFIPSAPQPQHNPLQNIAFPPPQLFPPNNQWNGPQQQHQPNSKQPFQQNAIPPKGPVFSESQNFQQQFQPFPFYPFNHNIFPNNNQFFANFDQSQQSSVPSPSQHIKPNSNPGKIQVEHDQRVQFQGPFPFMGFPHPPFIPHPNFIPPPPPFIPLQNNFSPNFTPFIQNPSTKQPMPEKLVPPKAPVPSFGNSNPRLGGVPQQEKQPIQNTVASASIPSLNFVTSNPNPSSHPPSSGISTPRTVTHPAFILSSPPPFISHQNNFSPNHPSFFPNPNSKQPMPEKLVPTKPAVPSFPNSNSWPSAASQQEKQPIQNTVAYASIPSNFAPLTFISSFHPSSSSGISTPHPAIHRSPAPARDFNRIATTPTPVIRVTQKSQTNSNKPKLSSNFGLPKNKYPQAQVIITPLNSFPHQPPTQTESNAKKAELVYDHTQPHLQQTHQKPVNQVAHHRPSEFRPVEPVYRLLEPTTARPPPPLLRPSNNPPNYFAADTYMDHHTEIKSHSDKNYPSPGFHNGYRGFPSSVTAAPAFTTKKPTRNRGKSPWKVDGVSNKQPSPPPANDQFILASNPSAFQYEVTYLKPINEPAVMLKSHH